MKKDPLLDIEFSMIFVKRFTVCFCFLNAIVFISIKASTLFDSNVILNFILLLTSTIIHMLWYTASTSILLITTLFASHLINVLTIELDNNLKRLKTIKRFVLEFKPGQLMTHIAEISDRIDEISIAYQEIIRFIKECRSLVETPLLIIVWNIFVSIISDTGGLYVKLSNNLISEKNVIQIMIYFSYLCFMMTELFYMCYGPQILLNRIVTFKKVASAASNLISMKSGQQIDKSVRNFLFLELEMLVLQAMNLNPKIYLWQLFECNQQLIFMMVLVTVDYIVIYFQSNLYIHGTRLRQGIGILSISITILTCCASLYFFMANVIGTFINSKVDIILNVIIVIQFYVSIIIICLNFIKKRNELLQLLNKAIYLKEIALKLKKNPDLDNNFFLYFIHRWVAGTSIVSFIIYATGQAANFITSRFYLIVVMLVLFMIHYMWYTSSVSSLLFCMLFASHLVKVITLEMKICLDALQQLKKLKHHLKPGEFSWKSCEISDRIDYINFCYYEIMQFVRGVISVTESSLLIITGNIFTSIITDIGNISWRVLKGHWSQIYYAELLIFSGYLAFAVNELYFLCCGPQKFMNRVLKLQNLIEAGSFHFVRKDDRRLEKSIEIFSLELMHLTPEVRIRQMFQCNYSLAFLTTFINEKIL
uniref:Gustatory receptor n=1 Tax=Culicoides sonorensis TaxID=179676 RepID=A0A336MA15_CULSO